MFRIICTKYTVYQTTTTTTTAAAATTTVVVVGRFLDAPRSRRCFRNKLSSRPSVERQEIKVPSFTLLIGKQENNSKKNRAKTERAQKRKGG